MTSGAESWQCALPQRLGHVEYAARFSISSLVLRDVKDLGSSSRYLAGGSQHLFNRPGSCLSQY